MLIPIQPSGKKPPLFLLHGNAGIMPIGTAFARAMGADRPVYIINAKGFDGSAPRETVPEMVGDYLEEILSVTKTGPIVLVGQCWGSLIALELADQLLAAGCELGPLILMDPPRVPFGRGAADVSEDMARQLYDYTRQSLLDLSDIWFLEMPFDANIPEQLHQAVLTGVASITAISKFNPKPFLGASEMILCSEAAAPFFARETPWKKILPNAPVIHVLPYGHIQMLHMHRFEVAMLVRLILEWHAHRNKLHGGRGMTDSDFASGQNARFG